MSTRGSDVELLKAIDQAIGKQLRAVRRSRTGTQGDEMSQEELADLVGWDRKTIGRLERGERSMTMAQLHQLAHALGVMPSLIVDTTKRVPVAGSEEEASV